MGHDKMEVGIPRLRWFGLAVLVGMLVACGSSGGGTADSSSSPDATSIDPEWLACSGSMQCVVRPASCCGNCGQPSADDMIGVNQAHLSDYAMSVCRDALDCPACAGMPIPSLTAICAEGRCEALDIASSGLSDGCTEDRDCIVRPNRCCYGCGMVTRETLIAVRRDAANDLHALLRCPGIAVGDGCPYCEYRLPPDISAECNAEGQCVVNQPATVPGGPGGP